MKISLQRWRHSDTGRALLVPTFRLRRAAIFPRQSVTAFTLIELLITIAIIGLLAALLLSASASVLEHARSAKCSSNLRTIVVGAREYGNDNNNMVLFAKGNQDANIKPVVQDAYITLAVNGYLPADYPQPPGMNNATYARDGFSVLACPTVLAKKLAPNNVAGRKETYGFNTMLTSALPDNKGAVTTKYYSRLTQASKTAMVADGPILSAGTTSGYINDGTGFHPSAVHAGLKKANIAFCDGHVECLDPTTLPSHTTPDGMIFWSGTGK